MAARPSGPPTPLPAQSPSRRRPRAGLPVPDALPAVRSGSRHSARRNGRAPCPALCEGTRRPRPAGFPAGQNPPARQASPGLNGRGPRGRAEHPQAMPAGTDPPCRHGPATLPARPHWPWRRRLRPGHAPATSRITAEGKMRRLRAAAWLQRAGRPRRDGDPAWAARRQKPRGRRSGWHRPRPAVHPDAAGPGGRRLRVPGRAGKAGIPLRGKPAQASGAADALRGLARKAAGRARGRLAAG